MTLHFRMKSIVKALNNSDIKMSAREICNTFMPKERVSMSDVGSVQQILNVMDNLGLVRVINISDTRTPRYKYIKTRFIEVR